MLLVLPTRNPPSGNFTSGSVNSVCHTRIALAYLMSKDRCHEWIRMGANEVQILPTSLLHTPLLYPVGGHI